MQNETKQKNPNCFNENQIKWQTILSTEFSNEYKQNDVNKFHKNEE